MKSEVTIDSQFFVDNRNRLRENFPGKAPIVITAFGLLQKGADIEYDFSQDSNFWFLTGLNEPEFTLVIDDDKEYIILAEANQHVEVFSGRMTPEQVARISGINTTFTYDEGWKQLKKRLAKAKHVATLSPSPKYIKSLQMYTNPARASLVSKIKNISQDIEFIDLKTNFSAIRSVKAAKELEIIKNSISATAALYKKMQKSWNKASKESDILADASQLIIKNNWQFAYTPIIASGQNAITLHYIDNDADLSDDELLLIDAGVKTNGYCADITRSVCKNPSSRMISVYEAVLASQNYAISLLKPGVILKTYEQAVRQYIGEKLRELGLIKTIDDESLAKYYPHSTSHFLGIDTHDMGNYDQPLAPGMVLTVEPGIYIREEGIGIRLEDDILITDIGNQNLSEKIVKDITRLA